MKKTKRTTDDTLKTAADLLSKLAPDGQFDADKFLKLAENATGDSGLPDQLTIVYIDGSSETLKRKHGSGFWPSDDDE